MILLGLIIFGGVRRIAQVTQVVVPFMALGYVLAAAVVVALNADKVPEVISLILSSAFGLDAGFGAMIGLAIQWGVKRGVYSNEAGQGTGPHAAAAAEVPHPAAQGLVQAQHAPCRAGEQRLLIVGPAALQGLAELAGDGNSLSSYRITDSPPDGDGPIQAMRAALERVAAADHLSRDVREIITKSLEN